MKPHLSIIAGQYSDKGIKEFNEDSCAIRVPEEPQLTNKGIVVAIADGVSSSSAGREASEACVKGLVVDYYSTPDSWTVRTSAQKVLGAINRWLYGQSQKVQFYGQGMLTTLSTIIIKSCTAHLFHVGDSRIYRLRAGQFERLTRDHVRWGSQEKSFLSRAMGADINIEIDCRSIDIEKDDVFLLTTDGVHQFLRTQTMVDLLQQHFDNPERASREIVKAALENGSDDNVTCQVCRIATLPNEDQHSFYNKLTELPFPPDLESGMVLDGFKIIREIHASQRTQVYLAEDTQTGEQLILKTPSVNYEDNPLYIDSFLNEEWTGRRIHSPHILKIHNSTRPRHFLYYVTEYIEGQTLRQWMNDHPRPTLQEVRTLLAQLIKGVRALQRMEMVHQDLKPENIMIDNHGTLKIVDFGSTRVAGIEEIHKPIHGKPVLGTINYSAPELIKEEIGTHASDIFSVGVIAYEMICGALPYQKAFTPKNMHQQRYIPSTQLRDDIPFWLDAALQKVTAIKPQNRYHTLSEFYQDITTPNPNFTDATLLPLLERNPLLFWKTATFICLCVIIFLMAK
ncbi:MAG: bifunctional protein-serine/threonine kinase/phosphatase [Gammaproteobacteria bacterium]|nr:bifunctional protein-serine/threonine kinase/phosphatase [Gammaproteobacteria bacterium]